MIQQLRMSLVSSIVTIALLGGAHPAKALTVPDTGTCPSGSGNCLTIDQNGTGHGLVVTNGITSSSADGVFATTFGTGNGVEGYAVQTGAGVYGYSSGGNGIYGDSTNSQGVAGQSDCGTGGTCIGVYGTSASGNGVWGNTSSSTNAAVVGTAPSGGYAFYGTGNLYITGSSAWKAGTSTWASTSDRRVKRDVKDFDQGLSDLLKVRPVRFHYNGLGGTVDDGKEFVGVIAQEVEKIFPSMVSSHKAKLHAGDKEDTEIKQVDAGNFTYLLIKAVQEQQRTIERQEADLDRQDARLKALEEGRPPMMSSMLSVRGIEGWLGASLLPFGIFLAIRRRKMRAGPASR